MTTDGEKDTCYECIHQSVCYIHKSFKNSVMGSVKPKFAEWFSDLFHLVSSVCIEFKKRDEGEEIEGKCLGCGAIITIIKGRVVNLLCYNCGTAQGYFPDVVPTTPSTDHRYHCPNCDYQLISTGPVVLNLKNCPGCGRVIIT